MAWKRKQEKLHPLIDLNQAALYSMSDDTGPRPHWAHGNATASAQFFTRESDWEPAWERAGDGSARVRSAAYQLPSIRN